MTQTRYPSAKALIKSFGITNEQANTIRRAMVDKSGLCVAQNIITDSYSIEMIALPDGCLNNCQTPKMTIYYVNRGDTYKTTLLRVNGVYKIGNWGDIVERFDR